MSPSQHDLLLVQRHHDGQLDPAAAAALQARLAREPGLARAAAELRAVRTGFVAARAVVSRAPAAFTANVLAAARQLPTRQQLEQADLTAGAVGLCRRLLLAAAILAGLGLVWQSGLVGARGTDTLQAAPGEMQRELQRLDALLAVGHGAPGDGVPRAR